MGILKSGRDFLKALIYETRENRLLELSGTLTYRLVVATVPFLIFLMSIVGSFHIDTAFAARTLTDALPGSVADGVSGFMAGAVKGRHGGVLSASLVVSLFSASSGFRAVMQGINAAYGVRENRGIVKVWLTSGLLVILLAAAIIATILLLIFGDRIYDSLAPLLRETAAARLVFGVAGFAGAVLILLAAIILIYRLAACEKRHWRDVLPGAALVIGVWILSSKLFNVYVNNFSRYSSLYGGVASVFILMLWLNLISVAILIGAQINALLFRREMIQ